MVAQAPIWVQDLARQYYAGRTCVFILHGNIHDRIWYDGQAHPMGVFLQKVVFRRRQTVFSFNRAAGLTFRDQASQTAFQQFLQEERQRGWPDTLTQAFPLLHRFLQREVLQRRRVALVIEYAESLVPQAPPGYYGAEERAALLYLLRWAQDIRFLENDITILLLTESLSELHPKLVQNPHLAAIRVPYPDATTREAFIDRVLTDQPTLREKIPLPTAKALSIALGGLSLVQVDKILAEIAESETPWPQPQLLDRKRTLIEAQAGGLLEFLSTAYTLEAVAGHDAVKKYLREVIRLLREGHTAVIPMGFLVTGPVGTGKTFLIRCLAGELGVPMVQLKNFRAPYVGQTEANLERVLALLEALAPVAVFIDEADTQLGRRAGGSDSGVSQRVFGMLVSFMSQSQHRGRILWFLATARPDLLPVDFKRQGRAEEHLPLFPPLEPEEKRIFVTQLVQRLGYEMAIPETGWASRPDFSGAEWESVLVRARFLALSEGRTTLTWNDVEAAMADFIPPTYPEEIAYMMLLAVSECTRKAFLPQRYREITRQVLLQELEQLRRQVR
jgi:AAA+ superfamily predicted ATPase